MRLFVICILFNVFVCVAAQTSDSDDNYETAATYYKQGDFKNAFQYFLSAAQAGNANAQNDVGNMYKNGEGVAQSYTNAFQWYLKAANQGNHYAQANLGGLYLDGHGVQKSYLKAYEWYLKAAEKEDKKAYNQLGYLFDEGLGVKQDYVKAFQWYSKAAELGNSAAQYNLGNLYYEGHGVNQDYMKAYEWYLKAAEQGRVEAQNSIGDLYYNGHGINQDYMRAFEWYSKAAEQGNAEAQNSLGDLYYYGRGVKQDYKKAFEWFKKSAEQGYAEAQNNLGYLYDEGYGIKEDNKQAYEWYSKAAKNGHIEAQKNLAFLYEEGEGVPKDYQKAIAWYEEATKNGDDVSPYRIGLMYLKGKGVKKDLNQSEAWFKKSIDNRNDNSFSYSYIALIFALRDKNYTKAIEYSDKALNKEWIGDLSESQMARIYGLRGQIYYLKGDMSNADKMLAKCVDLNPKYLESDEDFSKIMAKSHDNKYNTASTSDVDSIIFTSSIINRNTFAIIIGNEKYKNEVDVPYANNDARIFGEYVEKTLGVSQDQIRLVENAGYNDLRMAVNWLVQAMTVCRGKGKAIVYYAGHGIPNENDLSAYLLPVDGIGNDPGSAYSLKDMYEKLGSVEAQSITIFLDACFSGSKREEGMLASARGVALKAKQSAPKGNMIVFSAAQGDETAYPYKDKQHGMFTYFLLKKLQESKGEVTLGELSEYLAEEVGRQSFVKNNKMQTPTVNVASSLQNNWKNLKLK